MGDKKRAGLRRKKVRLFDGRSREQKLGLPPGTPIHVGVHQDFQAFASLLQYHDDEYKEFPRISADEVVGLLRNDRVNWINVEGIHDVHLVQSICSRLDIHPLSQEDIVNSALRPQFETYPGYFFFAMKMLYLNSDRHLTQEHVSLILKGNIVITFQETPGDVFSRIRDRIRAQTGRVRSRGADYLIYMLIDSIVDGYYQVIDHIGERIDTIEDEFQCGVRDTQLSRIYAIKREVLFLRKNIFPVRDLLSKVQVERSVFQENTRIFLKDLSDHIIQVTESLALSMEMAGMLLDTYHSMMNQKMNGIMKTLTMISTIFLPLNFIAGIYGMNFEHIPELKWLYGYPLVLGAMSIVVLFMILYFVRRGWLLENREKGRVLNWLAEVPLPFLNEPLPPGNSLGNGKNHGANSHSPPSP